jgi:hypothetical protein
MLCVMRLVSAASCIDSRSDSQKAGSLRSAMFKPTVPSTAWPAPSNANNTGDHDQIKRRHLVEGIGGRTDNRKRMVHEFTQPSASADEYGLNTIDDSDLLKLAEQADLETYDDVDDPPLVDLRSLPKPSNGSRLEQIPANEEPIKLPNGRYQCKHVCKDKTKCKHMCCRDGLDEPPKESRKKRKESVSKKAALSKKTASQQPKINQFIAPSIQSVGNSHVDLPHIGAYAQLDLTCDSPKTRRTSHPAPAFESTPTQQNLTEHDVTYVDQSQYDTLPPPPVATQHPPHRPSYATKPNTASGYEFAENSGSFSRFDGDGFEELEESSDLPSMSEVTSVKPNQLDRDKNLPITQIVKSAEDGPASLGYIQSQETPKDDSFVNIADWDEYIPYEDIADEQATEFTQEDFLYDDLTLPSAMSPQPSTKRTHADLQSSPLFCHTLDEAFNAQPEIIPSLNKRLRRDESETGADLSVLLPQINSRFMMVPTEATTSETIQNAPQNTEEEDELEAQVTADDMEWFQREFGSIAELI